MELEANLSFFENLANFSERHCQRPKIHLTRTLMTNDSQRIIAFKRRFELQEVNHGFEAIQSHNLTAFRKYIQRPSSWQPLSRIAPNKVNTDMEIHIGRGIKWISEIHHSGRTMTGPFNGCRSQPLLMKLDDHSANLRAFTELIDTDESCTCFATYSEFS
jgi:hypothetical protein